MSKSICPKCKEEFTPVGFYSDVTLCYSCKSKEETKAAIIAVVVVILAIVSIRVLWAKFVYKDTRCAFAECRINVDPK